MRAYIRYQRRQRAYTQAQRGWGSGQRSNFAAELERAETSVFPLLSLSLSFVGLRSAVCVCPRTSESLNLLASDSGSACTTACARDRERV